MHFEAINVRLWGMETVPYAPIDLVLERVIKITTDTHNFLEVAKNIPSQSWKLNRTSAGILVGSLVQPALEYYGMAFHQEKLVELNAFMVSVRGRRGIVFNQKLNIYQRLAITAEFLGHLALEHELPPHIGTGLVDEIDKCVIYEFIHHKELPDQERKLFRQSARWSERFINQYFIGDKDINNPFVQAAIPMLDYLSARS